MKYRILMLVALLPLCGCSVEQRVGETMTRVENEFAETKSWDELPIRVISWPQAIAMMRRNNRELALIRDRIEESERNELSVYTQMIPGVTFYGFFNSSIHDLTNNLNEQDLNSNINVNFSIPTITQVPYRVYAAKATTYANMKALEGKERELTAALYRHVRVLEVRAKQDALTKNAPPDIAGKENSRFDNSQDQNWSTIAKILGDSSARWVILPDTMPHVSWEVYEPKLNNLDELIVCQFALRLEQARLAQYNVALRYLPTINTGLYSPSLFSSTGGSYNGTFLDSKDTRINLSISYSLDTDMDIWNNYKRNKANYERTKEDVSAQLRDYRIKLQQARRNYGEYMVWRGFIEKKRAYLLKAPVSGPEAYMEREKELYNMDKELLNQEMQAIETEAALILQYGLLTE